MTPFIPSQISLIDTQEAAKPIPHYTIGQTVYRVILDTVEIAKITDMWLVRAKKPYWAYRIEHDDITDIDPNVYITMGQAMDAAEMVKYDKIALFAEELTELESYSYVRACDRHVLNAVIGKYGKLGLYSRKFMCYPFLYSFKKVCLRNKAYDEALKEMTDEAGRFNGEKVLSPEIKSPLYKTPGFYAPKEFVYNRYVRWSQC